jgi:uncharacterized protein (UPF0262 family)
LEAGWREDCVTLAFSAGLRHNVAMQHEAAVWNRLAAVTLDAGTLPPRSPAMEEERRIAINDLIAEGALLPHSGLPGPYVLTIRAELERLNFLLASEAAEEKEKISLPLNPFRGIIRDYFLMCESYREALHIAHPDRLQTIDMARRATHNEGSELLMAELNGKMGLDLETARRLFTLICVLHLK